jgi:hypothetical protein
MWITLRESHDPPVRSIGDCMDVSDHNRSILFNETYHKRHLLVCALDYCMYSSGMINGNDNRGNPRYSHLQNNLKKINQSMYSVHANWIIGNQAKEHALREAGLWIAEDPPPKLSPKNCIKYVEKPGSPIRDGHAHHHVVRSPPRHHHPPPPPQEIPPQQQQSTKDSSHTIIPPLPQNAIIPPALRAMPIKNIHQQQQQRQETQQQVNVPSHNNQNINVPAGVQTLPIDNNQKQEIQQQQSLKLPGHPLQHKMKTPSRLRTMPINNNKKLMEIQQQTKQEVLKSPGQMT